MILESSHMHGTHDSFESQSRGFEILARGLYTNADRILVCRSLSGGHCYLPGGHVEFGERPAAALAREIAEETGLLATIGPPVLLAEACFNDGSTPHHEFSLVFHVEHLRATDGVEIDARDPPASLEDRIAFEWIRRDELASQDFRPEIILDRLRPGAEARSDRSAELASGIEIALRGREH